ncbi:hypothetical protein [Brassicibacter mesophilus]|uniref:hypothetical protein n=1 Tax=Brassicibacter mesophilus TaxID=745119 RepID=UPI003D1C4616
MTKELKMVRVKKELVANRLEIVEASCIKLSEINTKITYENISKETNIPEKTLQREPYVSVIRQYRNKSNNIIYTNTEVKALKQKCEYQNLIISKLRQQIKSLNTELYKSRR